MMCGVSIVGKVSANVAESYPSGQVEIPLAPAPGQEFGNPIGTYRIFNSAGVNVSGEGIPLFTENVLTSIGDADNYWIVAFGKYASGINWELTFEITVV